MRATYKHVTLSKKEGLYMGLMGKIKALLDNNTNATPEEIDLNTPEYLDHAPQYTFIKALHAVILGDDTTIEKYLKFNPRYAQCRDWDEQSLIHKAALFARPTIIQQLIQHNTDINSLYKGQTPLHWLLSTDINWLNNHKKGQEHYQDQLRCLNILLKAGSDWRIRNEQGEMPIHIAARLGHTELLQQLLKQGGNIDELTEIDNDLEQQTQQGRSPLLLVARHNKKIQLLQFLLKNGANPNLQDQIPKYTALHYIASTPHNNDVNIEIHLGEITQVLLKYGACPNITAPLKQHKTPLHLAAVNNHVYIAEALLKKGADPQASADKGITPIRLAARQGSVDMIHCLLNCDVDINKSFALFHAAFCTSSTDAMALLIEKGADVNHPDPQGVTPLFAAISVSSLINVQFLLSHGADTSLHPIGRTVLQHAFANWGSIEALPENKRAPKASEDAKQIISVLGGFK